MAMSTLSPDILKCGICAKVIDPYAAAQQSVCAGDQRHLLCEPCAARPDCRCLLCEMPSRGSTLIRSSDVVPTTSPVPHLRALVERCGNPGCSAIFALREDRLRHQYMLCGFRIAAAISPEYRVPWKDHKNVGALSWNGEQAIIVNRKDAFVFQHTLHESVRRIIFYLWSGLVVKLRVCADIDTGMVMCRVDYCSEPFVLELVSPDITVRKTIVCALGEFTPGTTDDLDMTGLAVNARTVIRVRPVFIAWRPCDAGACVSSLRWDKGSTELPVRRFMRTADQYAFITEAVFARYGPKARATYIMVASNEITCTFVLAVVDGDSSLERDAMCPCCLTFMRLGQLLLHLDVDKDVILRHGVVFQGTRTDGSPLCLAGPYLSECGRRLVRESTTCALMHRDARGLAEAMPCVLHRIRVGHQTVADEFQGDAWDCVYIGALYRSRKYGQAHVIVYCSISRYTGQHMLSCVGCDYECPPSDFRRLLCDHLGQGLPSDYLTRFKRVLVNRDTLDITYPKVALSLADLLAHTEPGTHMDVTEEADTTPAAHPTTSHWE